MKIKAYFNKKSVLKTEFSILKREEIVCNLCSSNKPLQVAIENDFNICICTNCGLTYVNPQPSDTDLVNYYYGYFSKISNLTIQAWHQTKSFKQIYKQVEKYYPAGGSLLDVGCGLGLFLKTLDSKKWNLTGIDIDPKAIQFAQEGSCKNIKFVCNDIMNTTIIKENSMDVVTILACLEHVKDPTKVLKRVYEILKPGGRIFVRVPYIIPWIRLNKYLPFLPIKFQVPMHLYDFSPKTLKAFFHKLGYKEVEIRIAAPDILPSRLLNIMSSIIKNISYIIIFISFWRYIFPFSGGLLGIAKK